MQLAAIAPKPIPAAAPIGTFEDTEVSGLYDAPLTLGKPTGDPAGYASFGDAAAGLAELTTGEEKPAVALMHEGDRLVAHEVAWQWRDSQTGVATGPLEPANAELHADGIVFRAATPEGERFAGIVDGEMAFEAITTDADEA